MSTTYSLYPNKTGLVCGKISSDAREGLFLICLKDVIHVCYKVIKHPFSLYLSNCGLNERKIHFGQTALLHCRSQTIIEPLKDYSDRKSISLQSGPLSASPFRPVSCYKTSLIVIEATTVNKQQQYNMFLFQCHWFSTSLCLLESKIAAASLIHYCSEAETQLLHVVSQPAGHALALVCSSNESPVPAAGLGWWVICQRRERQHFRGQRQCNR